jgi:hypothetical protein
MYFWFQTLTLDASRFQELSHQINRLAIIGACLLTTGSMFQIIFGSVQPEFREVFKRQIKLLITEDDLKDEELVSLFKHRVIHVPTYLVDCKLQLKHTFPLLTVS